MHIGTRYGFSRRIASVHYNIPRIHLSQAPKWTSTPPIYSFQNKNTIASRIFYCTSIQNNTRWTQKRSLMVIRFLILFREKHCLLLSSLVNLKRIITFLRWVSRVWSTQTIFFLWMKNGRFWIGLLRKDLHLNWSKNASLYLFSCLYDSSSILVGSFWILLWLQQLFHFVYHSFSINSWFSLTNTYKTAPIIYSWIKATWYMWRKTS